ncbi:tetratricopeptide repeat protein [Bacteroidota bacterium]
MKRIIITLILLGIGQILLGQNYQSEFAKHYEANDTSAQRKLLTKWEKSNPNDPELYTSYFNYYFIKSMHSVISIDSKPKNERFFSISDSLNQVKGYLNSSIYYKDKFLNKGFEYINRGIEKFPSRLDMRFGKIYVLGQNMKWEEFTQEIIKTINYSDKIKNEWSWTNNKPIDEPINFFLSSLQDYVMQIYNTEDDSLLSDMRLISEKILEFHPEHIESLTNISITYLLTGEIDKGLEALLKAEKINPKDFIVLNNIAHGYKLKGNKQKAIEYYEKTIEFGDEQAIIQAKQKIKELKNE